MYITIFFQNKKYISILVMHGFKISKKPAKRWVLYLFHFAFAECCYKV